MLIIHARRFVTKHMKEAIAPCFQSFCLVLDGLRHRGDRCAAVPICSRSSVAVVGPSYSHSIVPGGLLVMSKTQRLTPFTSLMMRLASFSSRSYGSFTQSAVMPSCDSPARRAMV